MSKRSASIGYGSKYDFFKEKSRSPSPFVYETSMDMSNTRGRSFSKGRDVLDVLSA